MGPSSLCDIIDLTEFSPTFYQLCPSIPIEKGISRKRDLCKASGFFVKPIKKNNNINLFAIISVKLTYVNMGEHW